MSTGYTFPEIEAMTLHNVRDLSTYWDEVCPPMHSMVAAYLGIKPKAAQGDSVARLKSTLGTRG